MAMVFAGAVVAVVGGLSMSFVVIMAKRAVWA